MPQHELLGRLNEYRLDHDYTFEQLADAMEKAGFALSPRTLHYVLKRMKPDGVPHDRTLHRIRRFLESVAAKSPDPSRAPDPVAAHT